MPTIAIVGAGPGLGLALARQFGSNGHNVALIARNLDRLDGLVAQLEAESIPAAGFAADTSDPVALEQALASAAERFGTIDVLEYSPYAAGPESMIDPLKVTVATLEPVIQSILYGAVVAVQAVLPSMRETGRGTILLTAGTGSINPVPFFGTLNTAQAATRNWAFNLRNQLTDTDIYVAHVAIGLMIGNEAPAGYPHMSAAAIAEIYWDLYITRTEAERVITA